MLTLDDSGLAQGPGPGARAEEAAVLAREVAWEPLLTARLVGDRDLQYIKRYDKRDLATRRELLAEVRVDRPAASNRAATGFLDFRGCSLTLPLGSCLSLLRTFAVRPPTPAPRCRSPRFVRSTSGT